MTIQNNAQATIAFKAETTFGVAPTASAAKYLRRVSSNLNATKDTFASNEVRSDQQIADMRHGGQSARGNIEGELSTESYDDWIEALMRGTWTAGVSASPTDFATGVTIANSGEGSTLTFAGAGSLLTKGFKIGDVIRGTGLTSPANNAKNFRIIALTATVMTVYPAMTATSQQAAGWTISVPGRKVLFGSTKRSFRIEHRMDEASVYEVFPGSRIGGASINVAPNGMVTVSWDIQSLQGIVSSTAFFTLPTTEPVTGIVSGIDGALRLAGAERAILTGLQLNVSNNLSSAPVIGSTVVPDIFYGRKVVTGSVSAYIESTDLLDAFLNEEEVELHAVLQAASADPKPFLSFIMPRVKLSAGNKTLGPDGGVIGQFPFQALLSTAGGSGTAYDASTLTIQRSNT